MQEGEVFLVLDSGEVKPLADIEISAYGPEFADRFTAWQQKWQRQRSLDDWDNVGGTSASMTNLISSIKADALTSKDEAMENLLREAESLVAKGTNRMARVAECVADFSLFLKTNAIYSTRTGSRGDFRLPRNISHLLAGTVRPTGETPCWLVRIDRDQSPVRLSNSNLANKKDDWMLQHQP